MVRRIARRHPPPDFPQRFWQPLNEQELAWGGFDGAQWIFELKDQTGYHLLDLWCPDEKRASDEMLAGAGFDPAQLRDFLPYARAGERLLKWMNLEMNALPPEPDLER